MTHRLLTFFIGIISLSSFAQIAHWAIPPTFDDAQILPNGLVATSVDKKWGLHDNRANLLLAMDYNKLTDFSEDMALAYKDGNFAGLVDVQGNFIDLQGSDYEPVENNMFFSNGFLNVTQFKKNFYLNKKGEQVAGPFRFALPYFNGYALVQFSVFDKTKEELHWGFLDKNQMEVEIAEFNKKKSIDFLSSFRDGKAVCVYKEKGYFISEDFNITPINIDELDTKKSQIRDLVNIEEGPDKIVVNFKNGTLTFNRLYQLEKIESKTDVLYTYKAPKEEPIEVKSRCGILEGEDKFGLTYNDEDLLPVQFTDIKILPGDYALVKLNEKWGFLKVDPENKFQFKLNDNEHIGFNHRVHHTKLATLMPSYINFKNTSVLSRSEDCEIKIESREEKEYVECNTLTYDCRLTIPESLTDTLSMQDYTYAVKYDGLKSKDYKVTIPEWYVRSYEIVLSDAQYTVNHNDTIAVEFDLVRAEFAKDDENHYFKTVELLTLGNENIPLNKITENHYSFKANAGESGILSYKVRITENGCPTIEYPFEMEFEKQATKSKNKPGSVIVNAVKGATKAKPVTEDPSMEASSKFSKGQI